jgi:P-type Cu2+ transporter
VAMETADVVLMKSDPFDVIGTVILSRATAAQDAAEPVVGCRKQRHCLPIRSAGLLYPLTGWLLNPEVAASRCPARP